MKVYIVVSGEYEYYHIVHVFVSKNNTENHVKIIQELSNEMPEDLSLYGSHILEFEIYDTD